MAEEVRNYQVDRKYRVTFEQSASTKGVTGFKVEANGDDMFLVEAQAKEMLNWARTQAPQISTEVK